MIYQVIIKKKHESMGFQFEDPTEAMRFVITAFEHALPEITDVHISLEKDPGEMKEIVSFPLLDLAGDEEV